MLNTNKIIDTHIHFVHAEHFEVRAKIAGHLPTSEHLLEVFKEYNIVKGIAMGTYNSLDETGAISYPRTINLGGEFSLEHYNQPQEILYCAGVDSSSLSKNNLVASLELFEKHLRSRHCVGLKLYPGYHDFYVSDPLYDEFYALAAQYDLPVVVHTGDTARSNGLLKYSHPLTVDDVAVKFPQTKFVLAHVGNPWIVDAVAVAKNNPNVYVDLSGLAEGEFSADWFFEEYHGYCEHLKTWLQYLSHYDKLMYGSDWPLVNIPTYLKVIARIIPDKYHEQVFYENALRIFGAKLGTNSTDK